MTSTIVKPTDTKLQPNKNMKQRGRVITLITCVLGLYGTFLTWSILQERINTKPYGDKQEYFQSPLIINIIQALCASLVGFIYTIFANNSSPFDVFFKNDYESSMSIFKSLVIISITSSLASPLGYKSLNHLDYVAYLLAKSSKLIPVMFIHFVFYRTKFPWYKYLVAVLITLGVIAFTISHGAKKTSINDGNSLYGMSLLFGSMLLDGLTNSTQDQLFKQKFKVRLTGAKLMCLLNLFVFIISLSYTLIFQFDEVKEATLFIHKHHELVVDIISFSLCGAIGQIFVFIILEKFDSIVLITATVTRKMLSMILSVILFGHTLNVTQWIGVLLVFGGIGYESMIKFNGKKVSVQKKME
ncbi:uncharacterized protein SPAPADRAFT_62399 [Spathaspora passalidarum NRRL Y-27907]|uniref:UDP-galactose transporter homolog 1 n=1 Tax=Spathaspora passalidarum (strain NRRL Y-27907 / 11-Y1) TaxID=619300 RepID=G3ARQ3_SPAPN|nr:uncharacterized protein SPAPADRAFT_62399 [Spathaspora passalidarum NRRL Y-27907]EGW31806.1 hypothetical protein SPAPADRAFT_62399 [Spathaspora passalidarum NRRL Y-27907]